MFKNVLHQKVYQETLFPLSLIVISPNATILLSYIVVQYQSNIRNFFKSETIIEAFISAMAQIHW